MSIENHRASSSETSKQSPKSSKTRSIAKTHKLVLEQLESRLAPSVSPVLEPVSRWEGGSDTMTVDYGMAENGQAFAAHVSGDVNLIVTPLSTDGKPQAGTRIKLPGGDSRAIATGDRDGDGKTDILAAMYGSGEIVSVRGNADGTFQSPQVIGNAEGNPRDIFLAQQTGVPGGEVIAVDQSANALYTVTKDGHQEKIPVGTFPMDGAAIDFNGDGKDDLVIIHGDGRLMTLASTGNGRYQSVSNAQVGAKGYTVTAYKEGDDLFVIAATQSHTLVTYKLNAQGVLERIGSVDSLGGQHTYNVRAVDMNADGIRDLVVSLFWQRSRSEGGVSVLQGLGNGQFAAPQILEDSQQVVGVTVGRFARDGQPGIISASVQGGLRTFKNTTPIPVPPPPAPAPAPVPETISVTTSAIDAVLAASVHVSSETQEVDPAIQEILDALTRGNRLSSAIAIPVLEQALENAEAELARQQEEYRIALDRRRYNYIGPGEVAIVLQHVEGAQRQVDRFEEAILTAQSQFAETEEALPPRNTVSILGVNHNKLVLQVYAPHGSQIQPEIAVNDERSGWIRLEMGAKLTRREDDAFVTISVPFHGTMNGMVNPEGNRRFRVAVLVDGQRIEEDLLFVQWHPASRTVSLLADSFPNLLDQDPGVVAIPDTADVAAAQRESIALAEQLAPHLEPVIVNEPGILQNVPATIWESLRLPALTVPFLEQSRAALINQRYATQIAQGWKPGEVEWNNAWNEVYRAAQDLQQAAAEYHALLLRKNAGYEPGPFDLKRFEKAYPGFPSAAAITEALECRCDDATRALQGRKTEEQLLLERNQFLSGQRSTPPPKAEGLTDEAFQAYVRTLAVGYGDTADGGIGKILAYVYSVGRTMSTTELAAVTGRSPEYVMAMGGNYAPSTLIASLPSTGMGEGLVAVGGTPDWLSSTAGVTSLSKLRQHEQSIASYSYEDVHSSLLKIYTDRDTEKYPIFGGKIIRDDTVVGRIFSGLHQQLFFNDEDIRIRLIAQAEKILGIRAERLLYAVQSGDYMKLESALNAEFIAAGYGHIFVEPGAVPQKNSEPTVAAVRTDHGLYTNASPNIRVTFDITLPKDKLSEGSYFSSGNVYLVDGSNPTIQLGDALMAVNFSHTYTLTVPLASFRNAGINNIIGGNYRLKLGLFENGKTGGMSGEARISSAFFVNADLNTLVPQTGNSLSTLPEGDPKKATESWILTHIKNNFALDSMKDWKWDIGSDYHYGNSYDAADLNWIHGDDRGLPVYSVGSEEMEGTIVDSGASYANSYGVIRIQYTSKIEGKDVRWFVEYLHLLVNDTGQKDASGKNIFEARDKDGKQLWTFVPGVTKVKGRAQMGAVGGRGDGNDNTFSNHLHMKLGFIDETGKEQGISMRNLLTQELSKVIASDAGADGSVLKSADNTSSTVIWNETIQGWVPTIQTGKFEGVYFSHQNQESSTKQTPGYWYALATSLEEKHRIVWARYECRDSNNMLIQSEGWITLDQIQGRRLIWNNGSWVQDLVLTKLFDSSSKQYVAL